MDFGKPMKCNWCKHGHVKVDVYCSKLKTVINEKAYKKLSQCLWYEEEKKVGNND